MARAVPTNPRTHRPAPRGARSLVGPHFYYDLVRLARRGRSTLLRCAYGLTALAALFVGYRTQFSGPLDWSSIFAPPTTIPVSRLAGMTEEFIYYVMVIQSLAIFVLTPAYLAGAIAEEKERRTLELLFTTHLSDREIVIGKLLARVTHLAAILLTGVPILMATEVWGGLSPPILLATFFATALSLFSVGAICVYCSVMCRTVTGAVLLSYTCTAAFGVTVASLPGGYLAHPIGMFEALAEPQLSATGPAIGTIRPTASEVSIPICLVVCAAYNGAMAFAFVAMSVAMLRPAAAPSPVILTPPDFSGASDRAAVRARHGGPNSFPPPSAGRPPLPAVGDWPLLSKEKTLGRWPPNVVGAIILLVLVFVPVFLQDRVGAGPGGLIRSQLLWPVVLLLAGLWCTIAGFRAAVGITRERDQSTLEGLLLLPVSRQELLGAKLIGPVLYAGVIGWLLAALTVIAVAVGYLHPVGCALLLLAVLAHVAFAACVGLVISLSSRTTLWARVSMGLVLLVFLGITLRVLGADLRSNGPLAMLTAARPGVPVISLTWFSWDHLPWYDFAGSVGVSAPGAWYFLCFSPAEYRRALAAGDPVFVGHLITAAAGILAYALAARLLWAYSCYRFRNELRQ